MLGKYVPFYTSSGMNSLSEASSATISNIDTGKTTIDSPIENAITMPRAIAVLTNCIVGLGLISVPYCFNCGIIITPILIISIGILTLFSLTILIDCAMKSSVFDYAKLILVAFPKKTLDWLPNMLIIIALSCASILYLHRATSLIIACFEELNNVPDFSSNRWFIVFVVEYPLLFGLTLFRTMNSLSFLSIISIFLILIYIFHSIYYFSKYTLIEGFNPDKKMVYFSTDISIIIKSLSILGSTFVCHPTLFPTIVKLKKPTMRRLKGTMFFVILVSILLFLIGGIFPYLTLFDDIQDTVVLRYYYKHHILTIITKITYSIMLIITVPIRLFACRLSIEKMMINEESNHMIWDLIGIALITLISIIVSFMKTLTVVDSIAGGIVGPTCVFILPSIYYLMICKDGSRTKHLLCWASLLVGAIFIVSSLYYSIAQLI
ncbi:Transmembrane amino acid transporter protein [Tritrichomonas foetus]|uniref:Transmembrane amino acid transporter protein n=1 Tax=Tritrichomonas foetus TaxID=1144522 RepID=A0A1J4JR50_9EUKA|nr:Transmembrane amino acid transporter protein [Tritrichomonas foetus]|eukprot:OHT01226.1 Transmembrane amino acid transporter protein [Tritrichomonas foetus]